MSKHVLPIVGWAVSALFVPGSVMAQACTAGSTLSTPIEIDNSANPQAFTDLEVLLTLDTAAMISAGTLNADGSDLRFTDGTDCIPHTVESGLDTASTAIWVRVPNLPASGSTTIHLHHGNPAAISSDDPEATFSLFEGFDDDVIPSLVQACPGTPATVTSAGGVGTLAWASSGMLRSEAVFPIGRTYVAEADVTGTTGQWPGIYWLKDLPSGQGYGLMTASGQVRISKSGSTTGDFCAGHNWASSLMPYSSATGRWTLAWHATGDIRAEFPGIGTLTSTDTQHPRDADLRLAIGGISSGNGSLSLDWLRARQLADPAPSVTVGPQAPLAADLRIEKTASAGTAARGDTLGYTITAANLGPGGASDVMLVDALPASLSGCAWTASYSGGASGPAAGTGDLNAPVELPAGAAATVSMTCVVAANASIGTLTNTATLAAASTPDPTPANNSASAGVMITAASTPAPRVSVIPIPATDHRTLAGLALLCAALGGALLAMRRQG